MRRNFRDFRLRGRDLCFQRLEAALERHFLAQRAARKSNG
jgi:hypothetical protein